jgi:hypothetical protein
MMRRTSLLTRVRAVVSRDDERTAATMLGREDVLVRLLARRRARVDQLGVTLLPITLGIVGILLHSESAPVVLGAAVLVALGLGFSVAFSGFEIRDRAQEVIAAGYERLPLRVVRDERLRLSSHRERERFARSLERLLKDAQNWNRILPATRPPYGVRELRFAEREVHEVASLLRSDPVYVPGVARTARFLTDGASSPLFGGDDEALRTELRRIRDLLGRDRPQAGSDERLAA